MIKLQKYHYFWFLCLLIVVQSIYLNTRLKKLYLKSPRYLSQQQQKQAEMNLQTVAEPQVKQTLSIGGKLWLDSATVKKDQEFKLNIWGQFEKPVDKIDLRLFYNPKFLQVVDSSWQKDEDIGLAYLSISNPVSGESEKRQLVKTITFKAKDIAKTQVDFDFLKGSKMDCNVWDFNGNDALEQVNNGEVVVK